MERGACGARDEERPAAADGARPARGLRARGRDSPAHREGAARAAHRVVQRGRQGRGRGARRKRGDSIRRGCLRPALQEPAENLRHRPQLQGPRGRPRRKDAAGIPRQLLQARLVHSGPRRRDKNPRAARGAENDSGGRARRHHRQKMQIHRREGLAQIRRGLHDDTRHDRRVDTAPQPALPDHP